MVEVEREELAISFIAAFLVVGLNSVTGGFEVERALIFFAGYTAFFLIAAGLFRYTGRENRGGWILSSAAVASGVTVAHNAMKFREVAIVGDAVTATPWNIGVSYATEFVIMAGLLLVATMLYETRLSNVDL